MGVGLMSAGIGQVPPGQTFIDIGQGARINPSLYDQSLPRDPRTARRPGRSPRIPPRIWEPVRRRAADAPADLVPGLLGSTLAAAGVPVHAGPSAGAAAAMVVDERGRVPRARLPGSELPGRQRRAGPPGAAPSPGASPPWRRPPDRDRAAASGGQSRARDRRGGRRHGRNAHLGFHPDARLRALRPTSPPRSSSASALAVPDEVSGEPIEAEGAADPAFVQRLEDRLAVIGPRRGPVIGTSLLIWVGLAALAGLAFRPRGLRAALPLLAVAVAYLPAVLLFTAALQPSELGRTADRRDRPAGAGARHLAHDFRIRGAGDRRRGLRARLRDRRDRRLQPHRALADRARIPRPASASSGSATSSKRRSAALVPIATGAALVAWAPRASPRGAALAFALTGLIAVAAFAPGRFGADVGAAIGIPVGAAVAVAVCLGGPRRRLARW